MLVRPRGVGNDVRDTDYYCGYAVAVREGPPDDGRVAAEARRPHRVREDSHMRTRAFRSGREEPAEQWPLAEGREESGGNEGTDDALDPVGAGKPLPSAPYVRQPGEHRALSAPVQERRIGGRPERPLAALLGQHEEAILLGERQRAEQHAVHDAENGGVGSDGER